MAVAQITRAAVECHQRAGHSPREDSARAMKYNLSPANEDPSICFKNNGAKDCINLGWQREGQMISWESEDCLTSIQRTKAICKETETFCYVHCRRRVFGLRYPREKKKKGQLLTRSIPSADGKLRHESMNPRSKGNLTEMPLPQFHAGTPLHHWLHSDPHNVIGVDEDWYTSKCSRWWVFWVSSLWDVLYLWYMLIHL